MRNFDDARRWIASGEDLSLFAVNLMLMPIVFENKGVSKKKQVSMVSTGLSKLKDVMQSAGKVHMSKVINEPVKPGCFSAFYAFVENGFVLGVELLLRYGADVNRIEDPGTTALHVACEKLLVCEQVLASEKELFCVVKLLVDAGANVHQTNNNGISPWEMTNEIRFDTEEVKESKKKLRAIMAVCAYCGKPAANICSKCKKTRYCGESCQGLHWSAHKMQCKKST